MGRKAPDPDAIAAAHELAQHGCSNQEIAETLGTTEGTIRNWLKRAVAAPVAPSTPLPAHMAPVTPTVTTPLTVTDPAAMVDQLLSELHGMVQIDRAAGNMRGASSMVATIAKLATLQKQLSAAAVTGADTFSCPSAELAIAEATIDARLQALAERGPLRCSECSRALSVAWGTGQGGAPAAP